MITLKDDHDPIRAVGFVAVYSCYMEDRLIELINLAEKFISLKKNIKRRGIKDQAKFLREALLAKYQELPDYMAKQQDAERVENVLAAVEEILKERNHVIHSPLISNLAGDITQKNYRVPSERTITSAEIYELATDIYKVQAAVFGLEFCINRLHAESLK